MNPQQQAMQQLQTPQDAALQQGQQIFAKTLQRIRQEAANPIQTETPETSGNQQSAISQALGQLNDNSTAGKVGKAIASPNYAGWCLQWADDQLGNTNRQPTAIADYSAQLNAGRINNTAEDIPKNAKVYFNADSTNGGNGHVGLSNGDGTFTAATDNGIQTFSVAEWEKYSGQQFIGWAS